MKYLLVLAICAHLLTCGCSTALLLKRQKLQLLQSEYANLQTTDKLLTASPNPEILGQASVYVSVGTLNNVLRAADNASGQIVSIPGAMFHVDSVRTNFADGFPQLDIKAWAQKGDLKLNVTIAAVIEPIIPDGDPSKIVFRVQLLKVVPVAHWTIFSLRLGGFARELIQVKLQDYLNLLPEFSIPLRSNLAFANPAQQQSLRSTSPDGYVDGILQIPAFSYQGTLSVDRVLFLSDGVHILLSIKS